MANGSLQKILIPMVVDDNIYSNFERDNFPEVDIGGDAFSIIALRKDISVHSLDSADSTHGYASRIHIDCVPKSTEALNPNSQVWSTAAHVFIAGHESSGTAGNVDVDGDRTKIIVDKDALHAAAVASSHPSHARDISYMNNMIRVDADTLKSRYKAYIDAINGRNMSHTLSAFCHDIVIHNGKSLPLGEYQQLMEDAQAVMPDIEFNIAATLVDIDKQLLAARLDFRGTPIKEFAGVTPLEGVKKEVRFSEVVFYWFLDGKIAQVVSLVDWVDYRVQLTGQT